MDEVEDELNHPGFRGTEVNGASREKERNRENGQWHEKLPDPAAEVDVIHSDRGVSTVEALEKLNEQASALAEKRNRFLDSVIKVESGGFSGGFVGPTVVSPGYAMRFRQTIGKKHPYHSEEDSHDIIETECRDSSMSTTTGSIETDEEETSTIDFPDVRGDGVDDSSVASSNSIMAGGSELQGEDVLKGEIVQVLSDTVHELFFAFTLSEDSSDSLGPSVITTPSAEVSEESFLGFLRWAVHCDCTSDHNMCQLAPEDTKFNLEDFNTYFERVRGTEASLFRHAMS
uniref:Uncharacterized protein n=1 Tax=Trieres chinensis TaxID=1514140 RepID=A0A7S1ZBG3_TRICV